MNIQDQGASLPPQNYHQRPRSHEVTLLVTASPTPQVSMASEYDDYGRLRGNGDPALFDSRDPILDHHPEEYYTSRSRDNIPRRPDDSHRASPLKQNRAQKMSTTSYDSDSSEHVSAETIAAITERIKKEGESQISAAPKPCCGC